MALFPRQNPFSIRKIASVGYGELVQCEICYTYLEPGMTYDPSNPRCYQCWNV